MLFGISYTMTYAYKHFFKFNYQYINIYSFCMVIRIQTINKKTSENGASPVKINNYQLIISVWVKCLKMCKSFYKFN